MSNGLMISIFSDDDDYDIPPYPTLYYSAAQPSTPPLPKNAHQKSLSAFFTKKKGRKRLFHKPNAVQTRSGNGNGGEDNGKGREVGKKKTNELTIYTRKVLQKEGTGEWEASAEKKAEHRHHFLCSEG